MRDDSEFTRVLATAKVNLKEHRRIVERGLLRRAALLNVGERAWFSAEEATVLVDVLHAAERVPNQGGQRQ